MGKRAPEIATDAHISIVGHVTQDELLRYLSATDRGNGFGNRILWACVRRSKLLPEGGVLADEELNPSRARLGRAVRVAQQISEVTRDEAARALWRERYDDLSAGGLGLFGQMTARAEAHDVRLALLYALLEQSAIIRRPHLEAALALWQYCEDSARHLFGERLSDPVVEVILRELEAAGAVGLTRTQISHLFHGHATKAELDYALGELRDQGRAVSASEATSGRATERWRAVAAIV